MTVVGGAFFLVPFVVILIIMGKAVQLSLAIVRPVATHIPVESFIGLELPAVMAIFILVLLCFSAGLFATTAVARKLVNWLEITLLSNLPGYSFMKRLGEEAAGVAPTDEYESVLVRFDDAWQLGFQIERLADGKVVVFIPDSPSPWAGGVFIFDKDRITQLEEASTAVVRCLRKLGKGTGVLVKDKLPATLAAN